MLQIFPSRITLALVPESGVTVYVQDIGMSDLTNVECLGSDSSLTGMSYISVYSFTITILTQAI